MIPTYLALNDIISMIPAVGLGYYAVRMFFLTRLSRLEKGWGLIITGGFACSMGFFVLTLQDLTTAYSLSYMLTDYLGTSLSGIGFLLLMLGVRSHYDVWSLKSFPKFGKNRQSEKIS